MLNNKHKRRNWKGGGITDYPLGSHTIDWGPNAIKYLCRTIKYSKVLKKIPKGTKSSSCQTPHPGQDQSNSPTLQAKQNGSRMGQDQLCRTV